MEIANIVKNKEMVKEDKWTEHIKALKNKKELNKATYMFGCSMIMFVAVTTTYTFISVIDNILSSGEPLKINEKTIMQYEPTGTRYKIEEIKGKPTLVPYRK